jgi:hypothetical protein
MQFAGAVLQGPHPHGLFAWDLQSLRFLEWAIATKPATGMDPLNGPDDGWTLQCNRSEQEVVAGVKRRAMGTGGEQEDKADASNRSTD